MALISYEMAIWHAKQQGVLDGSPQDTDVLMKMEQATAHVLIYLKRPAEWDVDSIPADDHEFAIVQSLVLKVFLWLYRFRGDGENEPGLETILNAKSTQGLMRDPEFSGPG